VNRHDIWRSGVNPGLVQDRQYAHSLGEIVTAAANAGLRVEHLGEHVDAEINPHGVLTAGPDGRHRRQIDGELLPVVYGLRARKLPPDG
jgi:hypothetical protein